MGRLKFEVGDHVHLLLGTEIVFKVTRVSNRSIAMKNDDRDAGVATIFKYDLEGPDGLNFQNKLEHDLRKAD
jgi:hypothetical protein